MEDKDCKIAKYTLIQSKDKALGYKTDGNFIPCICYGRLAEAAEKYLTKGRLVVVSGEWESYSYTNDKGIVIYGSRLKVKEQTFCDFPKNQEIVKDEDYVLVKEMPDKEIKEGVSNENT